MLFVTIRNCPLDTVVLIVEIDVNAFDNVQLALGISPGQSLFGGKGGDEKILVSAAAKPGTITTPRKPSPTSQNLNCFMLFERLASRVRQQRLDQAVY